MTTGEAAYDYLFFRLPTGRAQAALAEAVRAARETEVLGLFTPQLGWANDEAALLVRSRSDATPLGERLADTLSAKVVTTRLRPTVRPSPVDSLRAGGIWVHRWFEVSRADIAAFVELSAAGWVSFETRFDAWIFGLFLADDGDVKDVARLLLITRYGDHGVWEASRDPTTEAMQIFIRRQQLTHRTWAASTRRTGP